jgi:hypothetical protein
MISGSVLGGNLSQTLFNQNMKKYKKFKCKTTKSAVIKRIKFGK